MTDHETQPPTTPLLSEYAGDQDMLELIDLFVQELPERIGAIEGALSAGDLEMIARAAHQLKGAGSGYGFPSISDAASIVEHGAKSAGDIDSISKQVEELTTLCRRAVSTSVHPD